MSQILFHYDFEGQIRYIHIIFSTSRTSIFISLLYKLILKSNVFSQYKEGEAFVTIAVLGRMKFSSCLAKHSWVCSLNSAPKGQTP